MKGVIKSFISILSKIYNVHNWKKLTKISYSCDNKIPISSLIMPDFFIWWYYVSFNDEFAKSYLMLTGWIQ